MRWCTHVDKSKYCDNVCDTTYYKAFSFIKEASRQRHFGVNDFINKNQYINIFLRVPKRDYRHSLESSSLANTQKTMKELGVRNCLGVNGFKLCHMLKL